MRIAWRTILHFLVFIRKTVILIQLQKKISSHKFYAAALCNNRSDNRKARLDVSCISERSFKPKFSFSTVHFLTHVHLA